MYANNQKLVRNGEPDDAQDDKLALLNILADAAEEKENLTNTQRVILNILNDAADEKIHVARSQRAVLNILDDFAVERNRLEAAQKASLNILDDSAEEKSRLTDTQRAALNILDDIDVEKKKSERVNIALRNEVAERARTEEALRQANVVVERTNSELEAFSYSVAHDLRAPLRSIDGFSQALLEDCATMLDEQGKTYLGFVRESAQHMARLIDDLLSLARVSRAELSHLQVDLAAIARTVFARLQKDQPDRAVELIMPEKIAALADARLLEVVLENLIGNAWKFTGKCARAQIEIGQTLQEGCPIYFVRDNGAGFDMAYAKKLFSVFQRLHGKQEFEGSGIGLAIVQRIIHRHGGRVWGRGEVGQGATFYFTLSESLALKENT